MASYSYQAISETGATISGVIDADSVEAAGNLLALRGYIPTKITEKKGAQGTVWSRIMTGGGSVKTQELILFTKQLRSMLRAGIPILTLLKVLEAQIQNRTLKAAISSISQDIRGGSTLYDAIDKHPSVFSPLYRRMVKAGEISGTMPDVLDRLTYLMEHEAKIKQDIKTALQYPFVVVIALAVAFFILLTYVVPMFVKIFVSAGIAIPLPTRICIYLYDLLAAYWLLLIGGTVLSITGLGYYFKTGQGRHVRDTILINIPIIGQLLIKAAMSRFACIFAILQSSGIPVMSTLTILSGTIGNAAIARSFDRVAERMKEGQGLSEPLRSARYFPPMVVEMVAVGEVSGSLDDMLREITKHYDDEVEYAVKLLPGSLGPFLIIMLAVIVGFFALAIFLPMWDLTKLVHTK